MSQQTLPHDEVSMEQVHGVRPADPEDREYVLLRRFQDEGRFRLMADAAPVMIWMSGPDKRCTYFNKTWLDFTGRPLEDQLGDGWSAGVHADDLQRCLATYGRAFDWRLAFRMEYRLQRCDGEYRWILDTGVPRFASDGTFEGYIGSCVDITDQKRGEEALRESERRLRLLLESTHAIPWVAAAQSRQFTFVGPQAARLLGFPLDAWYEEDFWAKHLHPQDREAALASSHEHVRVPGDYQLDYRMVTADGRSVCIHDVVHVVAEEGVARTLHGFMIDVTARRLAEEESQSLRQQLARVGRITLMGELAASIAHEVNQPLGAIVSNAQAAQRLLAADDIDLDEARAALEDIAQDGQRASAVLARIRGFLQKGTVQHVRLNVNDLVREVSVLMRSELARRSIALKMDLADRLPAIHGDRVQLQQVLLNLLHNAAEAMERVERGGRKMVLRSAADETGVVVAVQDAGAGIEPANLDRIFDAFYTTKPGGTGMGLAICRSIVQAHGGRIWAAANPEGGATVCFTLPGAGASAP
jgi:PAS domain S-box-containing protein